MRSARKQIDAAVDNVESALRELSSRLEDALPGNGRRRGRIARAEAAIRRTAGSVADRFPGKQTSSLLEDAGRTVRAHPVKVAMTAALAGYCAWSLIRFANGRTAVRKERLTDSERFHPAEAAREHLEARH